MAGATELADAALALVGRDPRLALAEADAVVASIPRPRSPDDVRAVATAHRAAGLALRGLSELVESEARLRRGIRTAERADLTEVAAEVRMSLTLVLIERGKLRSALATIDHASAVLRGNSAARARTMRAMVLHRAGRTREALDEYAAAFPELQRTHDAEWEARLRNNRALLLAEAGDTAGAIADLEWVREYDLGHGLTTSAADALWNMGLLLGFGGDIPLALELFDRAEAEWAGLERPELWVGRAEVLLSAGLVGEAVANARQAVAWLGERGWVSLEAEARLLLSLSLLSGPAPDLAAAAAHGRVARSLLATQDRPAWEALAQYAVMKAELLDRPSTRELDRTVRVASVLRDIGWDAHAADLRVTAGRAALDRGDVARTRTLLGPLAARGKVTKLDVRSRAWFATAMLAEAERDTAAADTALRKAWKVVETQRTLLGATELRAGAATHAVAIVSTGARLAVDSGSASAAFDWAELGRAAVLRYQPAVAPRDPEIARALTRLRWATQSDDVARLEGVRDPAAVSARNRVEAEVVRLTRARVGRDTALSPVSARQVRAQLRSECFVEFLTIGTDLWAVTVRTRGSRLTPLGPWAPVAAALDTLTFGLGRLLSGFGTATGLAAAGAAATRAAAALDAALLDPLRAELADDDLVLCPTGALTAVPWALLPGCRGRTVRVAPSATVWCRAREGRPERRRDVLVVAGPRLPGAESEAADVAGLHAGSTRLAGDDATVSRVVDAASRATLLHLAAHGRLRTDNPLFSTLELADGPLTGYDLETMGRTPDAVVLSACSSGAGHATVADETLGLAWTLMGLGTSTVVAPLLPVPDAGTRDLMVAVHTRVAAGAGLAEALALAQRDTDPDDLTAVGVASAFVAFGA